MQSRLKEITPTEGSIGHKILRVFIALNLLALGGLTLFISQSSNNQSAVLTSEQRPTKIFSLSESESLVYVIRLEQWAFGLKDRKDVNAARVTLSQGLVLNNIDGNSPEDFASPEYRRALKEADTIVQSAVPGFLPAELQKSVQTRIVPITEQIIVQARALVDTFQRHLNSLRQNRNNFHKLGGQAALLILSVLLALLILLITLNGRTTRASLRQKEEIILDETAQLNLLIEKLSLSESAVKNLEELSKTKTTFISNMNHELRTPLGSIIGYVEVVRDMTDDKPELGISNYLEVVDRNANMLLSLCDDIFSLSKLDSNLGPLAEISVDIAQVVEEGIIILQPDREKSNISINLSINTEASYFVQGDRGQLVQVVVNLLSNSIKFSKVNSHIDIEVAEVKHGDNFDAISITFRDTGIGIPATELGKLFTRFYRAKNAMKKQYPGTGLGLSIVEQIVHLHGGTIRVESVEGEGTTFTVELPKNLSPAEELVLNRRHAVLLRAITELEEAPNQNLFQVSHSLSGLIGFYTFEEESRLIRDFSNWLSSGNIVDPIVLESRRQSILTVLKLKLASLPQKDVH